MLKKYSKKISLIFIFILPWYLLVREYSKPRVVQLMPLAKILNMSESEEFDYMVHNCVAGSAKSLLNYNCYVFTFPGKELKIPAYHRTLSFILEGNYLEKYQERP